LVVVDLMCHICEFFIEIRSYFF